MSDKKVLGVCSFLSNRLGIDVIWIRIFFVVATVLGMGSPIVIYLILYALHQTGMLK